MAKPEQITMFEAIGGEPALTRIVHRFYQGVAADPVLRGLYPEADLGPAEERFRLFLIQYWGGPKTYSELRGHPRLRMRHQPFQVTPSARDHWLRSMRQALDEEGLPGRVDSTMWDYFVTAGAAMINAPDAPA
ncbi:MAG: globin [Candidatus Dormibacteraceae bacterium]